MAVREAHQAFYNAFGVANLEVLHDKNSKYTLRLKRGDGFSKPSPSVKFYIVMEQMSKVSMIIQC